jgi:hypothetical protein
VRAKRQVGEVAEVAGGSIVGASPARRSPGALRGYGLAGKLRALNGMVSTGTEQRAHCGT